MIIIRIKIKIKNNLLKLKLFANNINDHKP